MKPSGNKGPLCLYTYATVPLYMRATIWIRMDAGKYLQIESYLQNVQMLIEGNCSMKSIGEIEEELAEKAEPVLGFKPSSKFKRGPIGILIYVVCGIIAFFSLKSAGVF